jgi:hypothetical protein
MILARPAVLERLFHMRIASCLSRWAGPSALHPRQRTQQLDVRSKFTFFDPQKGQGLTFSIRVLLQFWPVGDFLGLPAIPEFSQPPWDDG